MCGIVGYVGPQAAVDVVVGGLRRLEYRGYDSAGVAVVAEDPGEATAGGGVAIAKKAGKLANLEKVLADEPLPAAHLGIGHTRWATHGAPNDRNAHPHRSANGRVALVHNGIIENYRSLRAELEAAGTPLLSETDTEIVAQLLGRDLDAGADLATAMRTVCGRLDGAFTLVAVDAHDSGSVVAARRNSPLVVGVGEGENFVASDVAAFIEHTREAIELGQDQVVVITRDGVSVTGFDGSRSRGAALPRRLGPVRRREGRVRLVHAQGDLRTAQGGGRHPAGPSRRREPSHPRRDPDHRGRAAGGGQDHHHRLRDGLLRRAGGEVRDRALDPDSL